MNTRTPRGFRDVLPTEAAFREYITTRCNRVFSSWGYEPVETPLLEFLANLELVGFKSDTAFKLFDSDGELLVLRPDITLPIARLVSTRIQLPTDGRALRLRYTQSVYREERVQETQARALTQAGVECIGIEGPAVDAEVLLLMAEALETTGVKDFTIAFCTVSVLRALLQACVGAGFADADWEQSVLAAWHLSDLVAVDQLAQSGSINAQFGRVISALARLQGGPEAVLACRQMIEQLSDLSADSNEFQKCLAGLDLLSETFQLVQLLQPQTDWLVDFTVMSSFDYYTGLVVAAYAPGVGYPLANGGRYDSTLAQFGCDAPAAGFALNLERIISTLMAAGIDGDLLQTMNEPEVVTIDSTDPAAAFRQAQSIRATGKRAALKMPAPPAPPAALPPDPPAANPESSRQ